MAELLAAGDPPTVPSDGEATAAETEEADALSRRPDPTPDLAEQPTPEQEDRPVVDVEPATEPAPKRRRRATSRPAGPPTL